MITVTIKLDFTQHGKGSYEDIRDYIEQMIKKLQNEFAFVEVMVLMEIK